MIGARVSASRVAAALASRMNDVMPAAIRLTADGCLVEVRIDGRLMGVIHTLANVTDGDWYDLGFGAGSVAGVMSIVQDDLSEYLRDPWPSKTGRDMAMPNARLDEQGLHMWFGESEKDAVLTLSRVPLDELTKPT